MKTPPLNKNELVLAVLSTSKGGEYTPVQLQKLFFLIDEKLGDKIGGPYWNFEPYHYGPFDKSIYNTLAELSFKEMVHIDKENTSNVRTYSLTLKGQEKGSKIFNSLPSETSKYILSLDEFVRSLSFSQLVTSVYKEFPQMRTNSIFRKIN